jgi:hypothetical protein
VRGEALAAALPDVAPTVLALLGLAPGEAMTGRVLGELFADHGAAGAEACACGLRVGGSTSSTSENQPLL